jgi:6-phosphofructokinase 1
MPRLAVMTSGGDAPGMNAAVRGVTRAALAQGWETYGVYHGYTGLIEGDLRPLTRRSVGGILHLAGTTLGTTRCEMLKTQPGREQALATLHRLDIAALIIIGGNGSQTGAYDLYRHGAPVVGIASTIDNDLYGTDISIGATTAVDVALNAINQLRATASSMARAFLVEVMGRNCGYLALTAAIAGGAEVVAIPELDTDPEALAQELRAAWERGKSHAIAVVAEGAKYNAAALLQHFQEHKARFGFELRATCLGHVQRGGAPGAFDRMLGTELGVAAVQAALERQFGVLIGLQAGKPTRSALEAVADRTKPADLELLKLARMLAL